MRASQPVSDGYAEQTRARYPDSSGYIKRDGVRLYYEVHGSGEPTIFLLPTWSVIHSRHWKMQIPYLARHPSAGWSPTTAAATAAQTARRPATTSASLPPTPWQ